MSQPSDLTRMEEGFDLAQALAEADRCLLCYDAPCSRGCPARTDPGTFIRKLRMRNLTGAVRTIKRNNILGGACGVLCPAERLCQKECSATGVGRPIEIAKLQRFLVEQGRAMKFQAIEKPAARPEKVAVVGSGPAGLSCAAELAKNGVRVTVFEARKEPGGIIRYGVPAWRFDRAFLEGELEDVRRLGVEFRCSSPVSSRGAAEALLRDGYRAVFLAPGLGESVGLKDGAGPQVAPPAGVWGSVDFLAAFREERFADLERAMRGKAVAVIGGGSVAIDCAMSALKLGARDVYLVYRRAYAQMPAEEDERSLAQNSGVQFLLLNQPVEYARKDGRLQGIRLRRTRLGEADASGRRKPVEVPGSDWTLEVDLAVEAIGNRVAGGAAEAWPGVKLKEGQLIQADGETGKTSAAGIFAGGDIVRGPALVVEAVQDGKNAARAIMEALKG